MKTVQDYLDLGLVFVTGDIVDDDGENDGTKFKPLSYWMVEHCNTGKYEYSNAKVESFAWRNNDGVKPEYKGLIEVCLSNAIEINGTRTNWELWERGYLNSVAKWRPVVLQSESPTVSPKEANPMKPVYTAEMHAKGELPPVGSEVKVCIEEAGFELEGNDPKHECKVVTVKAAFVNKDGEKIAAIENDKGNCACYIIECIKPIIKTIKVNGFDVPAPMSEAPMIGDEYFTPQTGYAVFYCANKWICDGYDHRFLSRGLVHATESAAIAHAKAMLGIDPNA